MSVASRCCVPRWIRRSDHDKECLDATVPLSVKDRVKSLNARDSTGPGTNLGDKVRNAPSQAPKPTPSIARQIGGTPLETTVSPMSLDSSVQTTPRPIQVSTDNAHGTSASSSRSDRTMDLPVPKASATSGSSLEEEVLRWVEAVSGEAKGCQPLMEWLKDGQVLCRTANKIQQGICPRINSQVMPFKQMENVTAFIQACRKLGVLEKDVFSTVDLYELKNPKAVLICIASLGSVVRRTAPSFKGPYIGVAQNANVADSARMKVAVTQDSGFRTDIKHEVRAGASKGRRI